LHNWLLYAHNMIHDCRGKLIFDCSTAKELLCNNQEWWLSLLNTHGALEFMSRV
jgi:hypothetical protein